MLNSIKNERRNRTNQSFNNRDNFLETKPYIYYRVIQEVEKDKRIQKFQYKKEREIKKKYYDKLKLYHNLIKLKNFIRRNKKKYIFSYIKLACQRSCKINSYNYYQITLVKKLHFFYELMKSTKILQATKMFKKDFIIKNTLNFLSTVREKINYKNNILYNNLVFYYIIVSNKFRLNSISKSIIRQNQKAFEKKKINLLKKKFWDKLVENFYGTNLLRTTSKFFYRKIVFNKIIKNINHKSNFEKLANSLILRNIFIRLRANLKINFENKNKENVTINYFNEKCKFKLFQIFKKNIEVIQKFKTIIKSYYRNFKIKIKLEIITFHIDFKSELTNLKEVYKNYKINKIGLAKLHFFDKLKNINNDKLKLLVAKNYNEEKITKRLYAILHKNYLKIKFLKMFIKTLKSIHNNVIMKNYIDLIKYKNVELDKIPHIVIWTFNLKLEKKALNHRKTKMKGFFKYCKKIIKNKNKVIKKLNVAEYFYQKKLMIKSFSGFSYIRTFLSIKNKFNLMIKNKLCGLLINFYKSQIDEKIINLLYKKYLKNKYLIRCDIF